MLISDTRTYDAPVDYIAQAGTVVEIEGEPAIRMTNGQIQQIDPQGSLSILNFDDYVFELSDFLAEDADLVLKASDRFLHELFYPDLSDFYQHRDQYRFLAEAHARLAGPLLNIAMALIAVIAVIGGNFSRRGYQRRIMVSVVGGLFLVILTLTIPPSAASDPALNIVQYLLPVGTTLVVAWVYLTGGIKRLPFPGRKSPGKPELTGA